MTETLGGIDTNCPVARAATNVTWHPEVGVALRALVVTARPTAYTAEVRRIYEVCIRFGFVLILHEILLFRGELLFHKKWNCKKNFHKKWNVSKF
tara:strand:+ start:21956 stop:22240 length:285 start_codon:yes stop_codon:yes gene_type:complete